jgi:hypothetical protein
MTSAKLGATPVSQVFRTSMITSGETPGRK